MPLCALRLSLLAPTTARLRWSFDPIAHWRLQDSKQTALYSVCHLGDEDYTNSHVNDVGSICMRGTERLATIQRSTPLMETALPDLPMLETVMVRLIRNTAAGMADFFEPVFRKLGLTENSFHVLCLLMASEQGRASPSELSNLVGTSRANMTRILDLLEREGLVSRSVEVRDARRHTIEITDNGRHICSDAVPLMIAPLKRAFSDLSPEEFATLTVLLRKVTISFDKSALPLNVAAWSS